MNSREIIGPDPARSRLRATVATVELALSRLPVQGAVDGNGRPPTGLHASFADLVDQLALGPEPEVRECPVCRQTGMRTATRCGYCWTKLAPLP